MVTRKTKKSRGKLPARLARRHLDPYEDGLARNAANHQPLTPLTALERAAQVFPDQFAIVHGRQRFTYAEFYSAQPPPSLGTEKPWYP